MLVGYMRVSSDSDRQSTDLQRDAQLRSRRERTRRAVGDVDELGDWIKSGMKIHYVSKMSTVFQLALK